jgi:cystathionine beta-lyase/cystathionine gamma-synthase
MAAGCSRSVSKGDEAAAVATAAQAKVWRRATSLGGLESLIEHRVFEILGESR